MAASGSGTSDAEPLLRGRSPPTFSLQELYEQGRSSVGGLNSRPPLSSGTEPRPRATTTTTTTHETRPCFALPFAEAAPPTDRLGPQGVAAHPVRRRTGSSATPLTDQLRRAFAGLGIAPAAGSAGHATLRTSPSRGGKTVPRLRYGGDASVASPSAHYSATQPPQRPFGLNASPRVAMPPSMANAGAVVQGSAFSMTTTLSQRPQPLPMPRRAAEPAGVAFSSSRDRGDVDDDDDDDDDDAFFRGRHNGDEGDAASTSDGSGDDGRDSVPLPPYPSDELPIVPPEHMKRLVRPIQWQLHPSAPIVVALLSRRGVQMPVHRDVIEYHMAEAFLDCLGYLRHGAYFVKYAQKHAAPKERFLVVQMQDDKEGRPMPYLAWYIHQSGVQIVDKVALDMLVGVSVGHMHSHAFRRHLVSHDIIKGCYCGNHKARFPTDGCFTLWFYDRKSRTPRSVDLLTTNQQIFDVWVSAMRGVLSVNSVCLTGRNDTVSEMEHYLQVAQQTLARGSDDAVNHLEGFLDH